MLHDVPVGQRLTNGHIIIISHGNDDNDLQSSQKVFQKELSHAATPGNGSLVQELNGNFGGSDRGERGI